MSQIDEWIDDIQKSTNPNIDKDQLTCATRLFHDCGLKKHEALDVRVSQIERDQNGNPISLSAGRPDRVNIPQAAQSDLKKCMDGLTNSGDQSDLLLPKYRDRRTLDRHLEDTLGVGFGEIHKAGMRDAHARGESFRHIAERFGISERSVEQSITGRITPAGKRKPDEVDRLLVHLENIPWIKSIEELGQSEAEVANILQNGTSRRFAENKSALEEALQEEFRKRQDELENEQAGPGQTGSSTRISGETLHQPASDGDGQPSSQHHKSFVETQIEKALEENGLQYDPNAPEDDPIKQMLNTFYFRED